MISEIAYLDLKARQSAYNVWADQFKQKNGWIVIPADAIRPVKFENEDRAEIETYEFMTEKPARYFAYVNFPFITGDRNRVIAKGSGPVHITGFMGQTLAKVEYYSLPKVSNMGDKRVFFSAMGINGVRYHGIAYITNGNYCRMRAYKKQKA